MTRAQGPSQIWEDNYPSTLSFLAAVIFLSFVRYHREWLVPIVDGVTKLVPAALNVSAIAVGFLATAQALLLSLQSSRILEALRESGHYGRLVSFFTRALAASFTSAILSALLTAMRLNRGGALRYICVITWAFSCLAALLCYYRASGMLSEILRINSNAVTTDSKSQTLAERRENEIEIIEG